MALIKWDETLSVHVEDIDAQHRELLRLMNELHGAISEGTGRQAVAGVLDELVAYTREHFAFEEGMLQRAAYPELTAHKAVHAALTAKALQLQADVRAGADVTMDVMHFLVNWLTNHIAEVDRKYSPYLSQAHPSTR
jgi:hemerythrin